MGEKTAEFNRGERVIASFDNGIISGYEPETDRYQITSPRFYGGAWIDGKNVRKYEED